MTDPVTRLNAALQGRYKVERQLGEGGMATVYLADDLRHERKVALKVLKPELAAVVGAERFLAEIKTTANLQHPHILPLHDSGEADGFLFYVMPYVEGESLRERIDRDHQLPVDDAVRIATNVAEALDYAHSHGVIHRDIKPANILLHAGKPVISDFGIALAVGAAGGGRLTETGLSLGTSHYMSPEQATGDAHVGPATDIYALGCVLYEMLTGDPPYVGSTAQAVLGKIIQGAPVSATQIRKSVPANVDAAIRKALEKLPADRFTGAQEFARALGDPAFRHGAEAVAGVAVGGGPWNRLTVATTVAAAVFALAFGWSVMGPEPPPSVERFQSPLNEREAPIGPFELTPDGSALVYVGPGESGEGSRLWIRSWDELDARPIPGTEGVNRAVFFALSPDGREVAFVESQGATDGGPLRVVPLAGGPSRTLAESAYMAGWSDYGWVYFMGVDLAIRRVRESGGPAETVTELSQGEFFHFFPQPLPGGRHLLFGVWRAADGSDAAVWAVDLETRERKLLTPGTNALYTASGHLLFGTTDGRLMAAPFDARRAELTGDAVPVAEGLATDPVRGWVTYSVSDDGSLVYAAGTAGTGGQVTGELVWVTRSGEATPVSPGETLRWPRLGQNNGLRLSPDGSRVAFTNEVDGSVDIWTETLPDGSMSRLTFDRALDQNPAWTPDGRSITFASQRATVSDTVVFTTFRFRLWTTPANGAGEAEFVYSSSDFWAADGVWSPDGEWLVMRRNPSSGSPTHDILMLRPGVDSVATPLIVTEQFAEFYPEISRDGRWLAYSSNETGRDDVFVRPFPNVGDGKWQVSTGGGVQPVWAHNGRELFFVNTATGEFKVAEFTTTSDAFERGRVTTLFNGLPASSRRNWRSYDVSPDDRRLLMVRPVGTGEDPDTTAVLFTTVLVQNFFEELKRLVPN